MKAIDVIGVPSRVLLIRGAPQHIRSANGPEFIAHAMRRYLVPFPERWFYFWHLRSLGGMAKRSAAMQIGDNMPAPSALACHPETGRTFLETALEAAEVGTPNIKPGSPWEKGYAESFRGKLRDELLKAELLADLREAKALAEVWQSDYNHRRPPSCLGCQTHAAFVANSELAAASAALGAPSQTPPVARPLAPGFLPSAGREEPVWESRIRLS